MDILEKWSRIASAAIKSAEQRKAEALMSLDPENRDEALALELFHEKNCQQQLVPVPGEEADQILEATLVRDQKHADLSKGRKRSAVAKVILWQACDICHLCGHEHGGGKDDDDAG